MELKVIAKVPSEVIAGTVKTNVPFKPICDPWLVVKSAVPPESSIVILAPYWLALIGTLITVLALTWASPASRGLNFAPALEASINSPLYSPVVPSIFPRLFNSALAFLSKFQLSAIVVATLVPTPSASNCHCSPAIVSCWFWTICPCWSK